MKLGSFDWSAHNLLMWAGATVLAVSGIILLADFVLYAVVRLGGLLQGSPLVLTQTVFLFGLGVLITAYFVGRASSGAAATPANDSVRAFVSRAVMAAGIMWMVSAGACTVFYVGSMIVDAGGVSVGEGSPLAIAWLLGAIGMGIGFAIAAIGRMLKPAP